MQSKEAHTETLHCCVVDTYRKCFTRRTVATCQRFFTAWEMLWTTSPNVCRSMRIVLERCHRELSLCVYVCAWYNDQPGLKVYMCNHTIIRKTSAWTLDGLCRYKCTGDCVRVNVFNHLSAFGYTNMTYNIHYYWKNTLLAFKFAMLNTCYSIRDSSTNVTSTLQACADALPEASNLSVHQRL